MLFPHETGIVGMRCQMVVELSCGAKNYAILMGASKNPSDEAFRFFNDEFTDCK
jgi:hypothetical protein